MYGVITVMFFHSVIDAAHNIIEKSHCKAWVCFIVWGYSTQQIKLLNPKNLKPITLSNDMMRSGRVRIKSYFIRNN